MHCTNLKAHVHGPAVLVSNILILIQLMLIQLKPNSQYHGNEWLQIINSYIIKLYSTFVLSFKLTAGSFMRLPQNDLQLHFHSADLITITELEIQHFFIVQVNYTLKCFE